MEAKNDTEEDDPSVDTAQWLCDVGKRRWPHKVSAEPAYIECPSAPAKRMWRTPNLAIIGLLTAAYLQYFYLDVLLEIVSLPSLIVFVLSAVVAG